MGVQSYLELYTTLIGWTQYQNLWDIIMTTGLIYLPFLGIVISNFIEPIESQEAKDASTTSLKRMEIQLFAALIVITLAGQPLIPLNPSVLNYVPVCASSTETAAPGNSNTTYDDAFPNATGAQVPVWWYAVMSFSNGLTRAAMLGINCTTNLRDISMQLNTTQITDPNLRDELNHFYDECYVWARSKYFREHPENSGIVQQYGTEDTEWLGSHTFQETAGYYDTQIANAPIKGFPYDPSRDFEDSAPTEWGRPTCQQWWSDSQAGLKTRLGQTLPQGVLNYVLHLGEPDQESAIKTLIKHNTNPDAFTSVNQDRRNNFISGHIGSYVGLSLEQLSYYPKLYLIIEAGPIVQALLLMGIYIFIAIAIPFSRYRVEFLIVGAMGIFSIVFWSYLWHLCAYVDQALIKAFYPVKAELTDLPYSQQGMLTDMVIGGMYIVLPMLESVVMGWAGIKTGGLIHQLTGSLMQPAQNSGNLAGNIASNLAIGSATSVGKNILSEISKTIKK